MKQDGTERPAELPRAQEECSAPWEPAGFLWEQPFKGVLQASPIIGLPCDPNEPIRDPNCS